MLHLEHITKKGDNLTKIGKIYGYDNPGPIYYFPPNQPLFSQRKHKGDLIHPGDTILIPWHPNNLDKAIVTSKHLIQEIKRTEGQLIRQEIKSKNEIDDYLKIIDAIWFIIGSTSSLVELGLKSTISSKEALSWLIEGRIDILSTFVVDSPHEPKRDFRFYIRHGLGPDTPSYWASVYAAIQTGDLDLYLYGTTVPHQKNVERIINHAKTDVLKLQQRITELERQKSMSFYHKRI
jgi:hypothetical protein